MSKYKREVRKAKEQPARVADLRVISGRYRGINLKSPQHRVTHPMGAREKLALFNMVSMAGARVLDAYAGSGALGIEALSRGAQEVVFVEANRAVGRILQENLRKIDPAGAEVQVWIEKVGNFAEKPELTEYFDVIMVDPPYDNFEVAEVEKLVGLLRKGGVLVLSSPADLGEITLVGMRISSTHTYARARITVYRKD